MGVSKVTQIKSLEWEHPGEPKASVEVTTLGMVDGSREVLAVAREQLQPG